jgi:hypothetical protein
MVGKVFKQRGKALYRNQIPDDVYHCLCATYLTGIFFFPQVQSRADPELGIRAKMRSY